MSTDVPATSGSATHRRKSSTTFRARFETRAPRLGGRASFLRRARASRREAVLAIEPDEVCARDEAPPLEHAASFLEEDDLVAAADRLDEPAAVCELLDQRCRDLRECGCDEDGVVRRVLGEPGAAVADDDGRVVDALAFEVHASGAGDVL